MIHTESIHNGFVPMFIYMYVSGILLVGINPKQPKDTWIKGHYSSHVCFAFKYYLWLLVIYSSDEVSIVNGFLWSMSIGSTNINNVLWYYYFLKYLINQ
jgi:hypothetical protein